MIKQFPGFGFSVLWYISNMYHKAQMSQSTSCSCRIFKTSTIEDPTAHALIFSFLHKLDCLAFPTGCDCLSSRPLPPESSLPNTQLNRLLHVAVAVSLFTLHLNFGFHSGDFGLFSNRHHSWWCCSRLETDWWSCRTPRLFYWLQFKRII